MNQTTKGIATVSVGIALYVCLSMTAKIPLIGHIGLDLGYIVLAVYCKLFTPMYGAVVGGMGCMLVSLLTSGWFPPGWILGNLFIGGACGALYGPKEETTLIRDAAVSVVCVFIGVALIKTVIECLMFDIPLVVKFPKNLVAFAADSITMAVGVAVGNLLNGNVGEHNS